MGRVLQPPDAGAIRGYRHNVYRHRAAGGDARPRRVRNDARRRRLALFVSGLLRDRRGWRVEAMAVLGRSVSGRIACLLLVFVATAGCRSGPEQWGPFRGQMVDAETGAPIPGAHFMVSWER